MTTYPTLYKRTSTGKVEQWRVWTEGAVIFSEHGYIGGKLTQAEIESVLTYIKAGWLPEQLSSQREVSKN